FPEALADEIAEAFRNICDCRAGWEHVIAVNSYHLEFPDEVNRMALLRLA
ncbi:MAG: hypothetical protein JO028_09190, partial [Acidobacteriaceae bacterium]|nr:hypothetical protein [Acidobacteriaceae bacterium]